MNEELKSETETVSITVADAFADFDPYFCVYGDCKPEISGHQQYHEYF